MTENCASCRFFSAGTSKAFPTADGMCRRWAPQGPVVGCSSAGWQVFPPMQFHEWCGEHRPGTEADHVGNLLAIARERAA